MKGTIIDNQRNNFRATLKKYAADAKVSKAFCPIRDILDKIGDKWSMLVILNIGAEGVLRFSEIKERIENISQRMLTVTLRALEEDGFITRKVYAQIPPRVEYALTPLGESLSQELVHLAEWAYAHGNTIMKSRKKASSQ